ncbi:MAG: hypothetical protein M0R03_16480, partial [Novosphingobium sp.]|nr:hypothetical protein [Novosphingobium sp.]
MLRFEMAIQIDPAEALGEAVHTCVTVVAPDPGNIPDSPVVWFGWPGGGYNRRYFDLQLPGRAGYSQAEYHARHGSVFIACDHVGVGDSSIPASSLNHSQIARINAATARQVIAKLREGGLDPRVPAMPALFPVAMGQSYGGLLLTHLQAEHGVFAGVAMLGWSGICTAVKDVSGTEAMPSPAELKGRSELLEGLAHPYRRSFHFDDVPEELVAEDLRGYPARAGVPVPAWATPHMPGGPNL